VGRGSCKQEARPAETCPQLPSLASLHEGEPTELTTSLLHFLAFRLGEERARQFANASNKSPQAFGAEGCNPKGGAPLHSVRQGMPLLPPAPHRLRTGTDTGPAGKRPCAPLGAALSLRQAFPHICPTRSGGQAAAHRGGAQAFCVKSPD